MDFKKVFVANRGEIAIRVIRACEELRIRTVAVYAPEDEGSLFFRLADQYFPLKGSRIQDTYLNMEQLIKIAKDTGCEAVHPGYGFLSESADFAIACEKAGLKFIGPDSEVMSLVSNKERVKQVMKKAGVPILPSVTGGGEKSLRKAVKEIGFPMIVKPSYGGGGKGMKIVHNEKELKEAADFAERIGAAAFGKGDYYIEKYLVSPHHIEVQILADSKGNVCDLGERECSIQRRHQKLIEETPSPALNDSQRRKVARIARTAAEAIGYENAGTIEFLYEDGNFYFLEVNARIQVEHTITELVTGIDLVKEQIRIAEGKSLCVKTKSVPPNGHAIECRVNAEDPFNDFMPNPGKIKGYRSPGGIGVRVDSGVFMGFSIPEHYDSLVSKLSVWGRTREEAVARMKRALKEYVIIGIGTTVPLYRAIVREKDFKAGSYTTKYIPDHYDKLVEIMNNIQRDRTFHQELLQDVFKKKTKYIPVCDAIIPYDDYE